ncbi:MAG TPA: cytochrome P450 [Amycolatopsis sp.]|uniref:cytochrome P450 n=1 Tax=Amycolatopsis sp. TaxID=37632 RepID=UPI002B4A4852|nr:cytochrome P450 [Amycolatopsis sp.]HKS46603.1 cytochrome P450 [Amycolatopsis sp.]
MMPFSPQGWSAEDVANPYPIYRRYRSEDPVHQAAPGTWYVFGYEHVAETLSSRDFSRNMPPHLPGRDNALRRSVENWLVFLDPPRHTRLRRLLAATFSPMVATSLRPRVAEIAHDLLRGFTDRHAVDLVKDFAAPLPVLVISELLGVPASLHDWFRERAEWLQQASSARAARNEDAFTKAEAAARELTEYFREEVRRRWKPRSDLVSLLAHAEGLTTDEITGTCVHLLTAGHETATNLIGKSVLALLAHPKVLERLRAEPRLVPAAVEELIRYDPPVQMVTRWATQVRQLGGWEIRSGDKVTLVLGSANRDPRQFAEPDELRLDRGTTRHCGFGLGIHYCLGAALARAEAEIALPMLLDLLSNRTVTDVRYGHDMVFHGPVRLMLTVRIRRGRAG